MAASKKRQRDLVRQIAESEAVDDDVQAAKSEKKAATSKGSRRGSAREIGREGRSARSAGSKSTKKTAKKTARKSTKKAPAKSSRGNTPTKNSSARGDIVAGGKGQPVKGQRASSAGKKARPNLRQPPPDRTCQAVVHVKGAEPKPCVRWTMRLEDDTYDVFCSSHSNSERAALARQKGADNLRGANQDRADGAALPPLFESPIDTQDDVARERLNLLRHTVNPDKSKRLQATAASTAAAMLKDVSMHIERYGSHQGQEGGHSIMRLLPGATIVEANFDYDRVFTKEDYEAIMDGMAQDERDGIEPARDVAEQAKRYLGRIVRPRDRSRYDREQTSA